MLCRLSGAVSGGSQVRTLPVIFKIERIDIPENDEEREWLAKQNFRNTVEDAYTG